MIIIQDTREKVGHKNHILKYFEKHNILEYCCNILKYML